MATETVTKQTEERLSPAERTRGGQVYRPNVDVVEQADHLLVLADMPGASHDSIDIQFENGTLAIYGRVGPRRPEGAQVVWEEFGVGDFHRTFQVSEKIDAARIEAAYSDGVLRLTLPKVEAVKPRKIPVRSN